MEINKKIYQKLVDQGKPEVNSADSTEDIVLYTDEGELKQYKIIIPQDEEGADPKHIYFWAKSDEDAFAIATMNRLPSLLIRIVRDKNDSRVAGIGIYENKEYEEDDTPLFEQLMPEDTDWDKYNEEQRKIYPNHGKSWTKEEEELLNLLYVEKRCSVDTLSPIFQRNHNAIVRKIINLQLEYK